MKVRPHLSLFWKLLLLCGGLILLAALTQHILLSFLFSSDAMRKLYLQHWQQTQMQQTFKQSFNGGQLTAAHGKMLRDSFTKYLSKDGYQIYQGQTPYLLLHIDALAVVNLNGDLIAQIGQKQYENGNLFTQLSLDAREDLVEALLGKDPFGTSRSKEYPGVTVAISLTDNRQRVVGALVINQRRALSDNWSGLWFGFKQVAAGIGGFVSSLLFACLFFALAMSAYLNWRLGKITGAVKRWQKGDFSIRIADNAKDELAVCSNKLNDMALSLRQSIEKEAQLASMQERQQLAVALHDTVKQRLFATSLKVGLAQKLLCDKPQQVGNILSDIAEQCQRAFAELEETINALRFDKQKQWADIKDLIRDWQQKHAIDVEFKHPENWRPNSDVVMLLWRVINEALQNIVKHAAAEKIRIVINLNDKHVQLSIKDNGVGCGGSTEYGQGLALLASDIEKSGGSLDLAAWSLDPTLGDSGSELKVLFPVNDRVVK